MKFKQTKQMCRTIGNKPTRLDSLNYGQNFYSFVRNQKRLASAWSTGKNSLVFVSKHQAKRESVSNLVRSKTLSFVPERADKVWICLKYGQNFYSFASEPDETLNLPVVTTKTIIVFVLGTQAKHKICLNLVRSKTLRVLFPNVQMKTLNPSKVKHEAFVSLLSQ